MADNSPDHIQHLRPFMVAAADNIHFTAEETDHLQECSMCYGQWKYYVDSLKGRRD
jgi:hypothetical protein